jgi:hypothetical protein
LFIWEKHRHLPGSKKKIRKFLTIAQLMHLEFQ